MKRTTTSMIKHEDIKRKWFLIDAKGKTLGRVATVVAALLRGKGKTFFSPHMDCGDFVVIVNAQDIMVTGNKEEAKSYFTHSGFTRGDKLTSLKKTRATHPERILYHAIRGMLPQNKLSDKSPIVPSGQHSDTL